MPKILIFGQNKISVFLHTALSDKGYETVDVTQKDAKVKKSEINEIHAIIDTYNIKDPESNSDEFIHNTSEVKSLLELSTTLNCPLVFLYQESNDLKSDSSVLTAIELIDKYAKANQSGVLKLLIEDIYGIDINTSQILQSFIQSMIKGDSLLVENDTREHYLLHQSDFVEGIAQAIDTYRIKKTNNTYTLFPESPITEIELAHFLSEINELPLDIEFAGEETSNASSSASDTETNYPGIWHPQTSLESGLITLLQLFDIPVVTGDADDVEVEKDRYANELIENDYGESSYDANTELMENDSDPFDEYNQSDPYQDSDSYNPMGTILKLTVLLIAILMIPTVIFTTNIALGTTYLASANENYENGELVKAKENSEKASKYLQKIEKVPSPVVAVAKILGIEEDELTTVINTFDKTANSVTYLVNADNTDEGQVLGTSTSKQDETYLNEAVALMNQIETTTDSFNSNSDFLNKQVKALTNPILENKASIDKLKSISGSLPTLLGMEAKQKYLLLIHDSNEITPMGGEIISYGILSANKGVFRIEDLYELTQIDASSGIRSIEESEIQPIELISQEILRASKNADYPTNAWHVKDIYELATSNEVDGVISINNGYIMNALSKAGPLNIPVYTNPITVDNYPGILDQYSKDIDKYTEVSIQTAKAALEATLGTSFYTDDQFEFLLSSLDQKYMMIYHTSGSVQSDLIKNNWAGSIQNHTDDYMYILDTNTANNKANKDVTRSIKYMGIQPTDEPYTRRVAITYSHNGENTLNNEYLNNLAILVPEETSLLSAQLVTGEDKKQITKNFELDPQGTKVMYVTDILIEPGQTVTVVLELESSKKTFEDNIVDLTMQKQPGMDFEQTNVVFNYPLGIPQNIKVPDNANIQGSDIVYTKVYDSDQEYMFPL